MAGSNFNPDEHVTGTIMALLGVSDNQGYFRVQDTCFAGIPFKAELPPSVEIKNRPLFSDTLLQKGARQFVAFTSGLNFGDLGDIVDCQEAMFVMSSFLKGQHLNSKMNKLAAQITRLVICGDSVRENVDMDEVHRGSYRT